MSFASAAKETSLPLKPFVTGFCQTDQMSVLMCLLNKMGPSLKLWYDTHVLPAWSITKDVPDARVDCVVDALVKPVNEVALFLLPS